MRELHFEYKMSIAFDSPVEKHRFTLKCIPRTDTRQEIQDLKVSVFPREFLSYSEDSFGNSCMYGYAEGKHDHFAVSVTGTAKTGLSSAEPVKNPGRLGTYKIQTVYTKPGPSILDFAKQFSFGPHTTDFEKALAYMRGLYGRFQYVQGVTDYRTTAEQAMALGKGVCQDYSNILLSLCRLQRIPARYIVGMLMGEGLSHAWVEVCDGGFWYALDPTNNLIVDDAHIRISAGRDYNDCTINQGIFTGQATQKQTISVSVRDCAEAQEAMTGERGGTDPDGTYPNGTV